MDIRSVKLEVFVPQTHLDTMKQALWDAGVGHIGNYDHCLSYSPVMSCWRPLEGTHPYLGSEGQTSEEPEYKIEACCFIEQVDDAIAAVKAAHPYEEPVINVLPLLRTGL
ncbi:MAG: hypothetical protein Q4B54_09075 [Coriobacteriales bacterium]|nr:hypothetical protein [Coriobacteriales bacterium]